MAKTDDFHNTHVKNLFREDAAMRDQKHKIYIQCEHGNEVTSLGKTCPASREQLQLEEFSEEYTASLRKACGGTVTIRLLVETAQIFLPPGKSELEGESAI